MNVFATPAWSISGVAVAKGVIIYASDMTIKTGMRERFGSRAALLLLFSQQRVEIAWSGLVLGGRTRAWASPASGGS